MIDDKGPYQRGLDSESKVGTALSVLKKEGLIRGFRRTKKYSKADRASVDYFVFFHGDIPRMPLQVKSSWSGKRYFEDFTDSETPCVVGQDKGIKNALWRIVKRWVRSHSDGCPA